MKDKYTAMNSTSLTTVQDDGSHSVLQNINEKPLVQTAETPGSGIGHACCGKCSKRNDEKLKSCGKEKTDQNH